MRVSVFIRWNRSSDWDVIRRLIYQGLRPGKIITQDLSALLQLLDTPTSQTVDPERYMQCNGMLKLLRMHRGHELRHSLNRILVKEGLQRFITHTVPAYERCGWGFLAAGRIGRDGGASTTPSRSRI